MASVLLPITLAAAGGAGIINFWLAVRTGLIRRATGVELGDGGSAPLIRRMRAHANFVEYTPSVLLLIALIEFNIGSPAWLWVVSAAFLLSRVAHALGMDGMPAGRAIGTAVTFAALVGLSAYAVALPFIGGAHMAAETMIRIR